MDLSSAVVGDGTCSSLYFLLRLLLLALTSFGYSPGCRSNSPGGSLCPFLQQTQDMCVLLDFSVPHGFALLSVDVPMSAVTLLLQLASC